MDTTTTTNQTMTLSIDAMSCGHCVQAVTKVLSAVPGVQVKSVAVGTARIEAKNGWAAGQAVAALQAAGYPARAMAGDAPQSSKPAGGCCGGSTSSSHGNTSKGGCCG